MYAVTVRRHMMVAHSLPDTFFGPAQGLHGATLVVEATLSRESLDEHAVVVDIGAAGDALDAVVDDLRYRNLDEHPAFAGRLSTTEAIARHVADGWHDALAAAGLLSGCRSVEVLLREHPDAWASYRRELS